MIALGTISFQHNGAALESGGECGEAVCKVVPTAGQILILKPAFTCHQGYRTRCKYDCKPQVFDESAGLGLWKLDCSSIFSKHPPLNFINHAHSTSISLLYADLSSQNRSRQDGFRRPSTSCDRMACGPGDHVRRGAVGGDPVRARLGPGLYATRRGSLSYVSPSKGYHLSPSLQAPPLTYYSSCQVSLTVSRISPSSTSAISTRCRTSSRCTSCTIRSRSCSSSATST